MSKILRFKNTVICLAAFSGMLAASCSTLSIKNTSSWSREDSHPERKLKAGRISADKPGGGRSIEREISELLPLLFLEKGYLFVENEDGIDYVVDVRATERDYYVGWEAKKSVSMEVVIWPADRAADEGERRLRVETPLASGRTVAQGSMGLASSKNTEILLRSSIDELVKSLDKMPAGQELTASRAADRAAASRVAMSASNEE